jgi:putative flippase GtrA
VTEPLREVAGQGARFIVLGLLNTGLTFLLYEALLWVASPGVAYTTAYVAGLAFVSVAYPRYAFRVARPGAAVVARIFTYYVLVYLGGMGLLRLADRWVGNPRLDIVVVLAVLVPVNFVVTRYLSLEALTGRTGPDSG